MTFGKEVWFAATAGGILVSKDHGIAWKNAGSEAFLKQSATSLEATLDGTPDLGHLATQLDLLRRRRSALGEQGLILRFCRQFAPPPRRRFEPVHHLQHGSVHFA